MTSRQPAPEREPSGIVEPVATGWAIRCRTVAPSLGGWSDHDELPPRESSCALTSNARSLPSAAPCVRHSCVPGPQAMVLSTKASADGVITRNGRQAFTMRSDSGPAVPSSGPPETRCRFRCRRMSRRIRRHSGRHRRRSGEQEAQVQHRARMVMDPTMPQTRYLAAPAR
jgi:hypothetical protein